MPNIEGCAASLCSQRIWAAIPLHQAVLHQPSLHLAPQLDFLLAGKGAFHIQAILVTSVCMEKDIYPCELPVTQTQTLSEPMKPGCLAPSTAGPTVLPALRSSAAKHLAICHPTVPAAINTNGALCTASSTEPRALLPLSELQVAGPHGQSMAGGHQQLHSSCGDQKSPQFGLGPSEAFSRGSSASGQTPHRAGSCHGHYRQLEGLLGLLCSWHSSGPWTSLLSL